jgi:hypothetical protein
MLFPLVPCDVMFPTFLTLTNLFISNNSIAALEWKVLVMLQELELYLSGFSIRTDPAVLNTVVSWPFQHM